MKKLTSKQREASKKKRKQYLRKYHQQEKAKEIKADYRRAEIELKKKHAMEFKGILLRIRKERGIR